MIGKEGHGERWMDDSVTLAVRVMCESTTMTDREGEVHALSADHEVVHNGIWACEQLSQISGKSGGRGRM